jgi:hypothetical protein
MCHFECNELICVISPHRVKTPRFTVCWLAFIIIEELMTIPNPETCNGRADGAVFTGLRVPEKILKLFQCQSVLLKILRICVKNNPVQLIPYWWNKYLKVEKIDHGAPLQVFGPNLVLDLKSEFSMQRYRKYTRINVKFSLLKNELFSNSRANLGRF